MTRYDSIGHGYAQTRREEPRIAERIVAALEGCESVLNVGAGAGSYEPTDRRVVAVEPSTVMIRQRDPRKAPAVCASAEGLPFRDDAFDASLAVLTIHHWPDLDIGLGELKRIARKRTVLLTFDTSVGNFWLTDYFPEIPLLDAEMMPSLSKIGRYLGDFEVIKVPVPHDCVDGFLGAFWRRPEAYLEEEVRSGTSVFSLMTDVDRGVARLRADLDSREWQKRYGAILAESELDLGYRLLIASH